MCFKIKVKEGWGYISVVVHMHMCSMLEALSWTFSMERRRGKTTCYKNMRT